jgi:tRNA threonylcarbamoyladenosine biosynthesis protein TsaE
MTGPPVTAPIRLTTRSAAATQAVAAATAAHLLPGDVILLDGDLGAGKTTFTQGLAVAMGVGETVTSPTFTLIRSYPTSFGIELIHADVYRLENLREIVALGLPELLDSPAVAVIEWGERALPAIGPEHLGVRLGLSDHADQADERHLSLTAYGARWASRWTDLTDAVLGAQHRADR